MSEMIVYTNFSLNYYIYCIPDFLSPDNNIIIMFMKLFTFVVFN